MQNEDGKTKLERAYDDYQSAEKAAILANNIKNAADSVLVLVGEVYHEAYLAAARARSDRAAVKDNEDEKAQLQKAFTFAHDVYKFMEATQAAEAIAYATHADIVRSRKQAEDAYKAALMDLSTLLAKEKLKNEI